MITELNMFYLLEEYSITFGASVFLLTSGELSSELIGFLTSCFYPFFPYLLSNDFASNLVSLIKTPLNLCQSYDE